MNEAWKWHYFMMPGFEYLVLGYSPEKHNILCVGLQNLHEVDKKDLMYIVDSDEGQREAYLVAILARHPYAGGGTWWDRLHPHMFFVELSQIKGLVSPEQLKVFQDTFDKIYPEPLFTADQEIMQQNSTIEVVKTENIDDILFGAVLSEEDRKEIAVMKRRSGII